MFLRIGKRQFWFERTKYWEWIPKMERQGDSVLLWFLNLHIIWDRAEDRSRPQAQH